MTSKAGLRETSGPAVAHVRDLFHGVPVVPDAWLERARLSARLDVATERTLAVVVAPAGAGKTVTMANWAREGHGAAVRWLNARQGLDLCALGWELVRAAGGRPDQLPLEGPPQSQIADICAALAPLRPTELVVVDDAHELPPSCFVLLGELLERCPDSLHVALLSRWDPPLPLLLLEAQGRVGVIRGHQLRMTDVEARSLVALHAGAQKTSHVELLVRHARGWAAVLVLAARYLRSFPESLPVTLDQVGSGGVGLADALTSEVFSSLGEQQRHVLLCVAGEPVVTPTTAARLSGDIRAGEVLADLERVGLLVERQPSPGGPYDDQVCFRLHPMLVEVLRRRLAAGGVEVMRARALVLRTARLDGAHGEAGQALRRMLAVRAFDEAADLVAEHGLALVVTGHTHEVSRLATVAPDVITSHRGTWLAMSLTRRHEGSLAGASYWARCSQECLEAIGRRDPGDDLDLALVHLVRAGSGEYDMTAAADEAERLLEAWPVAMSLPRRALILVALGSTEAWLGRLDVAAEHLAAAVAIARSGDFRGLLSDALSRLAMTELLRARTAAALETASAAVESLPDGRGFDSECHGRAVLVREMARLQILPCAVQSRKVTGEHLSGGPLGTVGAVGALAETRVADPMTGLLHLLWSAGKAAGRGRDGRAVLDASPQLPVELSRYVAVVLDLERCGYAIAAGDAADLRALGAHLTTLGATAEATCVAAVLADMDADLTRADHLLARVVSGGLEPIGSFVRPFALVCSAQIADGRGQRRRADALLVEALRCTAVQHYVVPFLGWSFSGSPVAVLLARLQEIEQTAWSRELYAAIRHLEPVAAPGRAISRLVSERQPVSTAAQAAIPPLTHRESDVLFALAHGSSYADIAATLVITENTVKTHVSSLYAKLGVTRRSHALHAARAAGLI
jgi:LuxR family transcriptional regulator, maltose regulon positive regulatory protein